MTRTLFARMNTKVAQPASAAVQRKATSKEDDLNGPQASMRTAVTMGKNDAEKTQTSMMTSHMGGVTSPFKDAMAKGVVSGMGMLTF